VVYTNNKYQPYKVGNSWQVDRYSFMAEYNRKKGVTEFGSAKKDGAFYPHILKITGSNSLHNFLNEQEILDEVKARFSDHKGGDFERVLSNTVASQPCCFNLFAPLKNRLSLASTLFSSLMGKIVQVEHIEIEFTPNSKTTNRKGFETAGDESLGDQSVLGGTDSDVAVFYTYGENKRGVILIEFKYIESEFSICSSYKDKNGKTPKIKNIRPVCDSPDFFKTHILPLLDIINTPTNPDCGYLKYNNWQLLDKSAIFDQLSVKNSGKCPFRFSQQQLWRNLLLAENVARVRKLDEFQFWVLSPSQNKWLWQEREGKDVESELRKILTSFGNDIFCRKDIKTDFVDTLKLLANSDWEHQWVRKFEERYIIESIGQHIENEH
jgi:hypothetical protein